MVGKTIAFAARAVAIENDCALAVEVGRGIVLVQVFEHWSQMLAAVDLLAGRGIAAVHDHHEAGFLGKERHLPSCIASVGAMGIGVDQLL